MELLLLNNFSKNDVQFQLGGSACLLLRSRRLFRQPKKRPIGSNLLAFCVFQSKPAHTIVLLSRNPTMSLSREEHQVELKEVKDKIKVLEQEIDGYKADLTFAERRNDAYLISLNNQLTELRKEKNLLEAKAAASSQQGK